MPIYEYVCKQCGKLSDVLQKLTDPPPEACPGCGAKGPLERVISRTSFVLKGGGWYSDLYGSSKKDAGAKKEGGGDSAPSTTGATTSSSSSSGDKAAPSTPAPATSTSSDKK